MSQSDLEAAVDLLQERQSTLVKAQKYYDGDVKEVFASPKLRRALERTGTQFRINFARVPVDAVLNRLNISTVHVGDELARTLIEQVWINNEMDLEINEVHRNALIYGDAYFMVWLDDEDPDNPEIVATYESPRNMHMVYYDENPRRKKYAIKHWKEDKDDRANVYYPETIERWWKKHGSDVWELQETEENPFGVIPIFHFRTRRPYGRPEHRDAWGIQDMVNKIVITQMATNDYQGFPLRYALENPDDAAGSSEFDDFEADTADGRQEAALRSGPGELWYLKGVKQVGQFDAADPETFLAPLREYIKALASTTDTPIHMFEGLTGAVSGESIRAAEAPLNKKVVNRQTLFGKTWAEVFDFILAIFGIEDVDTDVRWAPSQTYNDKEAWEVVKLKLEAGVPPELVFSEFYNEQQVEAILANLGTEVVEPTAPTLEELDETVESDDNEVQ